MPNARHFGLGLIAFAAVGFAVNGLSAGESRVSVGNQSYTLAVSGWSQMHLIELGTDWPTKTRSDNDKLMYCRHVVRVSGFEVGASCAQKATSIAKADY
ncbi:MAG: hypothetical protein KDJ45_13580 [Hyphomicrobiaceae bacterium]|nr:hypothetical protein [Hyphomicrobiaceae bacterium]MCC0011057.1 hypothetical protein [Hyphomicrobiaceae bacterium]